MKGNLGQNYHLSDILGHLSIGLVEGTTCVWLFWIFRSNHIAFSVQKFRFQVRDSVIWELKGTEFRNPFCGLNINGTRKCDSPQGEYEFLWDSNTFS